MTMPGYSGTPPKDVLTVSNLGTKTQNLNTTKVKGTSQGRMSSGFLGSTGGLTSGLATTATNLFGTFMGKIADDADPTTVESPEDVSDQVEAFFGNPGTKLMDTVAGFLSPILQGITSGLSGAALALANIFNGKWTQVNNAETTANSAATAANAANNTVQALITGGTRTIYTSTTSVTIPSNAAKVGVICMGTGGGGMTGRWINDPIQRATGGGYEYMEFPGSALAGNTYAITVPARGPNNPSPGPVTFGSLVSSPLDGTGSIVSSAGYQDANNSAPPREGAWVGNPPEAGARSVLAAGGTAGGGSTNGGAGGNASTTGTALAGGGAGGGGKSNSSGTIGGSYSAGGNGGFPGGPGGAGGRNNVLNDPGGSGGLGLCAVIVWT